jgi:hypothetical protein
MSWLYSVASSLGTVSELVSRGRWANHNQHTIEEGTIDFYKMAVILDYYSEYASENTTTFILDIPNGFDPKAKFKKQQVTVPTYYRWMVQNPIPGDRDRTFHIWLESGEKKKFTIYAKMDKSIQVCKTRLDERFAYITDDSPKII